MKSSIIAAVLTLLGIALFSVAFVLLTNDDPFPDVPGVTYFGEAPDEQEAHEDLIRYQNYDPEKDDYDPDLITQGEEAEEMAKERSQEWREEHMDSRDEEDHDNLE